MLNIATLVLSLGNRMDVRRITLLEWADVLPSENVEVFHEPEVLRVVDAHTTFDLHLFVGYKGQESVGFLPVFVRDIPGASIVLSPLPGFSISRMGPLVTPNSPKRRKRERLNQTFTEAVLNEIRGDDVVTLFGMVLSTKYTDPRPYMREGFEVRPRFSYQLDIRNKTLDDLLEGFTRDFRTEIRKLEETPLDVTVGGSEAAVRVYDDYRSRFAEQGVEFPTPRAYTRDLVERLDDRARVYTAEDPDGEFLGGITVLYSDEIAYFWQGGMRSNYDGLSVNSMLHWRIIEDIHSDPALDSVYTYDLGRAAVQRLGRYKSKFNSDLVPYYEVRSGNLLTFAKKAYEFVTY
jgi:hypothetical protein